MFEDRDTMERRMTYMQNKEKMRKTEGGKNFMHRGTYVGTCLYVSPEMLNDNWSGPKFTDLWALGVIVY